ncbi:hypothetical protein F4805DRAFT_476071 [Annulohypoxylon moriforme]|nr:hypothetical protein F4805DRAFT_476071 [Annulohypoxylon moriforme]
MCNRRRVFYACLHEDNDVTPPRSILYCSRAVANEGTSSTNGSVRPCAAPSTLPLTGRSDFFAGIVRSGPCENCVDTLSYINSIPPPPPPNQEILLPAVSAVFTDSVAAYSAPAWAPNHYGSSNGADSSNALGGFKETTERERQEGANLFDFDWDNDNRDLPDSTYFTNASNSTNNSQSSGTSGARDGRLLFNGIVYSNEPTQSGTEMQDFQLYDGDEFADELEEVKGGNNNGKK